MTETAVTIVLGATGEMGSAIARALAQKDHLLVLHGLSDEQKLEALRAELEVPRERCLLADVRDESAIRDLVVRAAEFGPVGGLVYAVGWNPTAAKVTEIDASVWADTLAVNLTGAFLILKHALPALRQHGAARVVLVSSIFGLRSPARRAAYAASKHGLSALVQCVAKEEGEAVQINGVCPGAMWSENVRHIFATHARESGIELEDYVKQRVASIPAGRFVQPEECASVVAFLMGPEASFLSGEMIRVAGGED